ncbi:MAG: MTAP family purine nucleoside phosphorylase [Phycisphaerales bacterium]|nr:MTAP family purine nucleoside phosphorylase [Phycisphaerales bacterium]
MAASLACIGGTAAYDLLRDGALVADRLGPQQTPFGESQPIYLCKSRFGQQFLFLSRHGETGYDLAPSFVNYRANLYALKDLGVRCVVSWSETRALCHNYKVGEYVIVHDLVDETRQRAQTFFENQGLGAVRQWPVFCPSLRRALATTLSEERCSFADHGVYVCVEGPRRETPAEARKYAMCGGELLGMTLAPEAFLARELQLCYSSICYVAHYAETGSDYTPFEGGRVLEEAITAQRARSAVERLPRVLERLGHVVSDTPSLCHCEKSMQQYIDNGQLTWDWRSWFEDHPAARDFGTALP